MILIKSLVFSHIVAVLSFGWMPIIYGSLVKSLSINILTLFFLLFNTPNGDTDPGTNPKISFKSFSDAKLKDLVLFSCLNFFKFALLFPLYHYVLLWKTIYLVIQ